MVTRQEILEALDEYDKHDRASDMYEVLQRILDSGPPHPVEIVKVYQRTQLDNVWFSDSILGLSRDGFLYRFNTMDMRWIFAKVLTKYNRPGPPYWQEVPKQNE